MADIVLHSVITGIHRTKVSAHRDERLMVEDDDTIPHIDPQCMLVKVPLLEDIPPELHSAIAYPKSRNPRDPRKCDQLVRETAGRKVGNVPSNLCGLFRKLKRDGQVKEIYWYVMAIYLRQVWDGVCVGPPQGPSVDHNHQRDDPETQWS